MSLPPPPLDPQPVRVEPLGFDIPTSPPRPGILVAVGVISIIGALLSFLSNCSGGVQAFVLSWTPVQAVTFPIAATGPGNAAPAAPIAPPVASITEMTPAQRQTVIIAFNSKYQLTPPRLEMLDMLLLRCGDEVLPFSGESITQENVAGNVSAAGETPVIDGQSNAYYVLANGRIEVGDNDAVFSPTGRRESVRVNRAESQTSMPRRPRTGVAAAWAMAPATTPATTAPAISRSGPIFISVVVTSLLSMALAVLLFVAGIQVLRDHRSGRKLHLIYAWAKFPIAILTAVATHLMTNEYLKAFSSSMQTPFISGLMTAQVVFWGIVACVYPVALIIVMKTRTVRTHYEHLVANEKTVKAK